MQIKKVFLLFELFSLFLFFAPSFSMDTGSDSSAFFFLRLMDPFLYRPVSCPDIFYPLPYSFEKDDWGKRYMP
jgi:hypothetical protein